MITLKQYKKEIFINVDFPHGVDTLILKIKSDRNKNIVNLSQRSDNTPANWISNLPRKDRELWLPTVDVKITPAMWGRINFSSTEPVSFHLNGYYNKKSHTADNGTAIVDADEITPWENGLYVLSKDIVPTEFFVELPVNRIPTINTTVETSIELLTQDFSGTVTSYYEESGQEVVVDTAEIKCHPHKFNVCSFPQDKVKAALESTLHFVMSSVIKNSTAPQNKGFYLFYDLDSKSYIQPTWAWGWGPSIKLLMDAASSNIAFPEFTKELLCDTAYRAGLTTLRLQVHNKEHVMDGAGTTRWSICNHWDKEYTELQNGYGELVNGASDSGFLAGWGWIPIYNYTNDHAFIVANEKLAKNIEQQLNDYIVPPQEYMPEGEYFTATTIDESGFGAIGLSELYLATGDKKYAELCKLYMDRHLEVFDTPNGFWERKYNLETKEIIIKWDDMLVSRGQGWALIGLLAAAKCCDPENKYIERAIALSDNMVKYQNDDGSFNFRLDEHYSYTGIGEKAVALWSLLFYQIYQETKYTRYLAAARKALNWCINNQYLGSDLEAYGCIPGNSEVGAVGYRQFFNVACQYTSGFFGLALLEELKLR